MNNPVPRPGRNERCPCGSGRRYKNCCGAAALSAPPAATVPHYLGWDAFTPAERASLWKTMLDALAAQRAFRNDVAGRLYESIVARAPLTFDAVHMLGTVRMVEGDLDAAESLLTRALELAPDEPTIRHNLQILAQRRQDHEGLYSVRAIVAADMLRLHGASLGDRPRLDDPFAPARAGMPLHVVIPGDPANAGSNQTGIALARRLGADAQLWAGPTDDTRIATAAGARLIGATAGERPSDGALVVFGLNPRVLSWLPAVATSLDALTIALDAHDPSACVELLGRLSAPAAARLHFVARSAALLEDLGLPGSVDPMVFAAPPTPSLPLLPLPPAREHDRRRRPRIGVFIPALRNSEDSARWQTLEWLRGQDAFLRVLYAGRLPSPHIANADEHLVGLATDWEHCLDGLDGLFYWGAEGHMRQYDRLVFEALDARMNVVADGYGDFGAVLAARDHCAQFFTADAARRASLALLVGPGLHGAWEAAA